MRDKLVSALRCFALLMLLAAAGLVQAREISAGPEDYRAWLARLGPGDRLVLSAGEYRRGLPLNDLQGRPDAPIVIEGPRTGPRARFVARAGANTLSLVNVRHVTIRNLELDGMNLPVDAVKAEGHARFAHHVTLENLYIHDHAASQQNVGISTKCPAFGWIIRDNRIERVGTGMYLGNSDGRAPFVAGLIEDNRVTDSLGYNVQIKHQRARPDDLPEAGTRHDTIIRGNFFSKVGAQPGPNARPNVLVGHFPLTGPGSEDRYLIYANRFWQNPSESLFQGEGNIALYNNVFVTEGPEGVRIQPHNDVPREVRILFNTVVVAGNGITVRTGPRPDYVQLVAANLVCATKPIDGGTQEGNVTDSFASCGAYTIPGVEEGQLRATRSPPPRTIIRQEVLHGLLGIDLDVLGRERTHVIAGAFAE